MTNTPKFINYKLTLHLEAQSPMIHFQGSQAGATLRASEVKPKLDRYIFRKLIEAESTDNKKCFSKQDISKVKKKFASLFRDEDHDAFDYKLSVYADKAPWHSDLDPRKEKRYQIFYGNQNRRNDRFERVISDPIVSIMCFNEELQQLILKYIEEFFIVTNFGTMQSKGFGSYAISGTDYPDKNIAECLRTAYGTRCCYKMEILDDNKYSGPDKSYEERDDSYDIIFNHIGYFYKIMKSGWNQDGEYCRSYIYQYMHDTYGMPNEKAWMKHEGIAPSRHDHSTEDENSRFSCKEDDYRYVRAFLGTAGSLRYLNTDDFYTWKYDKKTDEKKKDAVTITISPKDTIEKTVVLERVSSPIFFKVIRGAVYIVGASVPDDIYNKKFYFSNNAKVSGHQKTGTIRTPNKKEIMFDMDDFMSNYVRFYNTRVPKQIRKINAKHVNAI